MKDYKPELTFSDAQIARFHDHRGDEAECVDFLAEQAGDGRVLELAIGTGRIALPLAERGIPVSGIDFSETMLARLREKPGGDAIPVSLADYKHLDIEGEFSLIFIVWNSFFNLLTQDDQLLCFSNVAKRLAPNGRFIIEAYVPSFLHTYTDGQQVRLNGMRGGMDAEQVHIRVQQHDAATQMLEQMQVSLSASGNRLDPVVQRYAWPSELDLMAKLAGLQLQARYADWHKSPFDRHSQAHVSVYA